MKKKSENENENAIEGENTEAASEQKSPQATWLRRLGGETTESASEEKSDPEPAVEPLELPVGLWKRADYLLQNSDRMVESIRRDKDLGVLIACLMAISLIMAMIYGAVMGATNLLQGSEMAFHHKLILIVVSGLKTPILFLLTLAIVLPPIYVSNAFVGAQLNFKQMLTLLLSATCVTTMVLASMASVAFFFALTSRSYDFIKLLHVVFFAYAGVVGLQCFVKSTFSVIRGRCRLGSPGILLVWLCLYVFVGTQLAWVLRPFVGSPGQDFTLFRERTGNFYESVIDSMEGLVRDGD